MTLAGLPSCNLGSKNLFLISVVLKIQEICKVGTGMVVTSTLLALWEAEAEELQL